MIISPTYTPPPGPAPRGSSECAVCGKVPDEVQWEPYRSDDQSWAALSGREGFIASCSLHHRPVYYDWNKVG